MVHYARHFALLGSFTAALAVLAPWRSAGIGAQFALYGALHASAFVLSLTGTSGPSLRRRLLFVAFASILALATARLGLFGLHAASTSGRQAGYLAVPAACAGLGSLAYGLLIDNALLKKIGTGGRLSAKWLGATSLVCAAAISCSAALIRAFHTAGILWLVVPWWFAFSGALGYAGAGWRHKIGTA